MLEPVTRKVRYVGCARNAAVRIASHWRQRNSTFRSPVKNWLCNLAESPEFEVVQVVVSDEQAQAAETYWIKLLRQTSVGPELLNVLDGQKKREETRTKISSSLRGFKHSDAARKNMGLAALGNQSGKANRGRTLSEEHRRKISEGVKATIEAKKHGGYSSIR
jgi:hypothetical protein